MTRQVTANRPQLVCILADNSPSMKDYNKAAIATDGIREMIMRCQFLAGSKDHSLFHLLLIQFDRDATVILAGDNQHGGKPVSQIHPASVTIDGGGDGTNLTAAFDCLFQRLSPYLAEINKRDDRDRYPPPLVLLFSDGQHNVGSPPHNAAARIKGLRIGEDPILVVTAALTIDGSAVDEQMLRELATPGCFLNFANLDDFAEFLAEVGSSKATSRQQLAHVVASAQQRQLTYRPKE